MSRDRKEYTAHSIAARSAADDGPDAFEARYRSAIMRAVRERDTGPELQLRRSLHSLGLRYRIDVRGHPGSPDLVFPRWRAVVFVHGCFWHAHSCPRGAREPKRNAGYWSEKRRRNKERDLKAIKDLADLGWRVRVVWECELKDLKAAAAACAEWIRAAD